MSLEGCQHPHICYCSILAVNQLYFVQKGGHPFEWPPLALSTGCRNRQYMEE